MLDRVYTDMPERQAVAVKQNLRITGLYKGELDTAYSPALGEAINQVHFDLDMVDDRYQLDNAADASGFLQSLASTSIRPSLINDLSVNPAEFVLVEAPGAEASPDGRGCSVSGGTYSRSGELIALRFHKQNRQVGIEIVWDGWPSPVFPRILAVGFGDTGLPLMVEYEQDGPITNAYAFTDNGFWVTDAMKQADRLEIGPESDIAPLELPTGSLYQAAKALENC
ncbi:hypothetical protein A6F65_02411 [Paraurantiacibacter namhicola]|uniref:Uncharacterized protein n=1 Tax=Paraurantiacibacter namhicola TaxID=645517 RepID=A0A1C7DBD3_9SPHN|nr:hypothetical protein A6F65_02411 [Paraurantiacibacter namhicola]